MASRFKKDFQEFYEFSREDIYSFCAALNFNPHWQQCELFDVIQAETDGTSNLKTVAVKSGQGPGKTVASVVIALFRTWRHEGAITFVTAPTQHQVRDVWLAECRRVLDKAHPMIRKIVKVTKTRVVFNDDANWGIWTVPASKPETFAGRHHPHMTIICDEATGIEREIMETIQGTLTNPDNLWVSISNPTKRDSYFFDFFNKNRARTHCITFNAEETPESEYFSKDAQRKLAEEYGAGSDIYAVRVRGEFPGIDPTAVMSIEDLEACTRYNKWVAIMDAPSKTFGIDLARYGADESVIAVKEGNALTDLHFFTHQEPAQVLRRSMKLQEELGWEDDDLWYVVDASGMGEGAMHVMYEEGHGKNVFEFKGQYDASDSQYENMITEAYFELARRVRSHKIHLPNDNRLLQQLCTRQYLFTNQGKIMLEPKKDYVKRLGESPDRADAAVMAFYNALTSVGWIATRNSKEDMEDTGHGWMRRRHIVGSKAVKV